MSSIIEIYISSLQSEFNTQQSTEHSFRPALKTLLESLEPNILALNESQRIVGVGMPDFTIKDKKDNTVNIGRIEAKDLYVDLDEKKNSDQLGRYLSAFDNFIYTNNLTFIFYRNGKKVDSVTLGTATKSQIIWNASDLFGDNLIKLERLLRDFLGYSGQTITSPEKLARAMAQKAQLIKYAIETIFEQDGDASTMHSQYTAFKDLLVHDLTPGQFADMYAQTIAYGLFSARLYDPSLPTFSREEAEKLIPKSTPFIRRLFKQMTNDDDFDDRVAHIIDDLVYIFLHCDVAQILQNYGKSTKMQDPIIHFYETFLGEYDSAMRKKRGVYYTPQPVVQFIVKGVDHILKKEFGLPMGLADTSKIEYNQILPDGKKLKKSVHRIQILDPATGTGTFLNEVIQYIHTQYFAHQTGMRNSYVTADLLPRIWGFEILMASYTMAHLKLGLTLHETGWTGDDRIRIYLTNSLEEPHDHIGTLFSQALAKESEEASRIKKEQPIMIVIGNPPYSVSSSNKGERIQNLIGEYKKNLNEKSMNSLSDDYIKFIRYAQYFIEKNGEGIIGYITNNSYIDGITHRQMRKTLLETFDSIYIYDLHGNSKKKEVSPDGSKDENVFDIMQGVSIQFFIKTNKKKKGSHATVYHHDSYGKRVNKYEDLIAGNMGYVSWTELSPHEPYYFFVPKDFGNKKKYDKGIKIDELFLNKGSGIKFRKDSLLVQNDKDEITAMIDDVISENFVEMKKKYNYADSVDRNIGTMKKYFMLNEVYIKKVLYRPFDFKYCYYPNELSSKIILRGDSRYGLMRNLLCGGNYCLILRRTAENTDKWSQILISDMINDINLLSAQTYCFPLYLYSESIDGSLIKTANLNMNILQPILDSLKLVRIKDGEGKNEEKTVGPADILDYIYAVLHSPKYRETYKEFLKIDFPRVPFTGDAKLFRELVGYGRRLRKLHLLEDIEISDLITSYPIAGTNEVGKITKNSYMNGKVIINDCQYFENVPQEARNFRIGGYQPAQKWLKDRAGRIMNYEDILHYQKMIVALTRTHQIMGEIDKVGLFL